jgi:hypothetical protein
VAILVGNCICWWALILQMLNHLHCYDCVILHYEKRDSIFETMFDMFGGMGGNVCD